MLALYLECQRLPNRRMSVSVIIPTYNSAEYLSATIQSALHQTVHADEVIVVDDGSTDATPEMCAEFSEKSRYYRQPNQGVSAARNLGAANSSGDWLLFLDSDDRLLPHAIESLRSTAESNATRLAFGYVLLRGPKKNDARLHGHPSLAGTAPLPALKNFWRSMISSPGAVLVHRSLHQEVGGFVPGYEPMEDRDYWVKCGTLTAFSFCDTCVLDKTWRENSAASQASKRILNGMRAQFNYLGWCRERGIDPESLAINEVKIVERAIKRALWEKRREILPELLTVARERNATGFWYYRARAELVIHGASVV
jgi:glycosyltransferase involved in cell wall biosynthesis